jgi:predicted metal-dependent hydrolase
MTPTNPNTSLPLTPRQFTAEFAQNTPRHWLPGNPVVSAIMNTYTVLVPANESFYIRTLKLCMPKVREPDTRWMIVDFVHQEAQHGVGHRRYWDVLQAQGYKFRSFENTVDKLTFRVIDRVMPLGIRLSVVSCVEHINAYMAHDFLSQEILAHADPRTRAMFEWHFAEEIEHKHVAYDVLQEISGSYAVRLIGALLAAPLFYLLMTLGTLKFLNQDGMLFKAQTWKLFGRHLGRAHHMAKRALCHLYDYLRPSFHPGQLKDSELAQAVIARYTQGEEHYLQPTARVRKANETARLDVPQAQEAA